MLTSNKLIVVDQATGSMDRPVVYMPNDYRAYAGLPLVVIQMGSGYSWEAAFNPSVIRDLALKVVEAGFPVVTTDTGGDTYGNARSRTAIDNAIAFAQDTTNMVRSGPVHLAGFSMGGAVALSWAGNNRARALSFTGWCPLVDLNLMVEAGGATKAALDAAYGGAYNAATHAATNNPMKMAQDGKYTNLPMSLLYSDNDSLIPGSRVTQFKNAVGASATVKSLGAVGHDNTVPNLAASVDALLTRIKG